MKLTKNEYVISKETLEMVLEALGSNWFVSTGDGDEDNNDEIIAADRALQAEISAQQLRAVDATPTSAADSESSNGVRH